MAKKKFKTYGQLEYFFSSRVSGGNRVLHEIYTLERDASKFSTELRRPSAVKKRILQWWNDKYNPNTDVLSHRSSYVLMQQLKKEIRKRKLEKLM